MPKTVKIATELIDLTTRLAQRDDCRRTLVAYSRFDETPKEQIIELTDEGYVTCGTKANARRRGRDG